MTYTSILHIWKQETFGIFSRLITKYERSEGIWMDYIHYLRQYIGTKPIIAVGAAVIVMNENEEILLQLQSETNDWRIPGGTMEMGDSFEETAKKVLFEETGLYPSELRLAALASGSEMYYQYPHGDEVYNATAVYRALNIMGELKQNEESKNLQYFSIYDLPQLNYITFKLLEKAGIIHVETV